MNVYHDWNFSDNPFKTTSLEPGPEGIKLIAGRDREIRKLSRRLFNQPQIVTVEGFNGVGKTSIINVAVYHSYIEYFNKGKGIPLFVPCIRSFQINPEKSADEFMDEVFIEIAQTLIRYQDDLKKAKVKMPSNLLEIDQWLNDSHTTSYQISGGFATFQVGGGETKEANATKGFEKSGFRRIVRNWLRSMFPSKNNGGIVCVIDNLEILENSSVARRTIEELRDNLFAVQGIRWVMCGALGIITSIVASPRLEGMLHDPIKIEGIDRVFTNDIFNKRMLTFSKGEEYYMPLSLISFRILYDILKCNIRNTLKYANDFCIWIDENDLHPVTKEEKEAAFMDWISEKCDNYYNDIRRNLTPQSFKLFRNAITLNDGFAISDYELFDYPTAQEMKKGIMDLENCGLLISVIDEQDRRRKSIQITPKGWFVSYHLGR